MKVLGCAKEEEALLSRDQLHWHLTKGAQCHTQARPATVIWQADQRFAHAGACVCVCKDGEERLERAGSAGTAENHI